MQRYLHTAISISKYRVYLYFEASQSVVFNIIARRSQNESSLAHELETHSGACRTFKSAWTWITFTWNSNARSQRQWRIDALRVENRVTVIASSRLRLLFARRCLLFRSRTSAATIIAFAVLCNAIVSRIEGFLWGNVLVGAALCGLPWNVGRIRVVS